MTLRPNAGNLFNQRHVAMAGETATGPGDYRSFLPGFPRQFYGAVGVTS